MCFCAVVTCLNRFRAHGLKIYTFHLPGENVGQGGGNVDNVVPGSRACLPALTITAY